MQTLKHFIVALLISLLSVNSLSSANTVFVANHVNDGLAAYEIDGNQIEFRETIDLPENGFGPVDAAFDANSGLIFVTNEADENSGGNVIELIRPRTLLRAGTITLTHENAPSNIAGIVVDNSDSAQPRIFLTDRNTKKLYTYLWDSEDLTMTLRTPDPSDPNDPDYVPNPIELDSVGYACGIDLDEERGLLYVSDFYYSWSAPTYSQYVYVYDRDNDWELVRTIDMGQNVVGIALDDPNEFLYGGAYGNHNYLVKYDLSTQQQDPNNTHDIGANAIGLAIDQDSELVYVSTYNYGGQLEVWDTELPFGITDWALTDSETEGIDGPAGVCVATTDFVPPFSVSKVADVNDVMGCIIPRSGEQITYTISYSFNWTEDGDPNLSDFTQIHIEDFLPYQTDFVSADPADPNLGYYNSSNHSYVWIITPENYGDPNSFDITVEINNKVTPSESIENTVVEIVSDIRNQTYKETAEVQITICECADNGIIIYVDNDATGDNDGTSWTDAYVDLQSALKGAFPCDQVWVAEGTYIPENEPNDIATFRLVNAVGVYGGFDGTDERDWLNNETILSGYIDPNNVNYVVTTDATVRWAILDGFTITRGLLAGVCFEGGSVLLEHNFITDNGIGVLCDETLAPIIRNNWIYENATGMSFEDCQDTAIVRNNTVVDNDPMGVYRPSGIEPSIKNCIFWGHADANDLIGCYATYSCIEYPTHFYEDPNETIYLGIGQGNIDDDPSFETGDYHLSSASPGRDAGDPNATYYHQRDIDKEFRVLYGRVDMGADEYYDCSYVSDADFTEDGIVNFPDYGEFAQHWLKTDSDPNWSDWVSSYDLAGDDEAIDVNDLALFADEWLWMDCDTMTTFPMEEQGGIDETYEMMMMSSGSSAYGLEKAQAEPTLKEQTDHALEVLDFLETLWKKDKELRKKIDEKQWDHFIDKVCEWFYSLEDLYEKNNTTLDHD